MYLDGKEVTDLTIPEGISEIKRYAFYDNDSLTRVTIPEGVKSIGECAFHSCSNITSVIWDAENCVAEGSFDRPAFSFCYNLKSITFGEKVKIIPAYLFNDANKYTRLESAEFKNPNDWSVRSVYGGFEINLNEAMDNPLVAAQYLQTTYCGYIWTRKD